MDEFESDLASEHIEHLTDLGNAHRFVKKFGDKVRFCPHWGKWLVWDGSRWKIDEIRDIENLAKDTVRTILGEVEFGKSDKGRESIRKHALNSQSRAKIFNMLLLAQSDPGIATHPDDFDQDIDLFNVKNGVVNLVTGKLMQPITSLLITKQAPVEHDPDAYCPKWLNFLDEIFEGNQNKINLLQRLTGHCLSGHTKEQIFVILYGEGGNGKSIFVFLLQALLGEYSKQIPAATLMLNHFESIPNDLAMLKGARLVMASESGKRRRIDEEKIKLLTGEDKVPARFLRQEFFEYYPQYKLFLVTNKKPLIDGKDFSIGRRIIFIDFNVKISEEKRDRDLREKLRAELPGILNWAIEGNLEWRENGLQIPDEVRLDTDRYRSEMDPIQNFISDCCELGTEKETKSSDLYEEYVLWCRKRGEIIENHHIFGKRLGEKGFQKIKRGSIFYEGIGLI
jgi:putative DNA primase/helicase